jgi:hypothetical protein
VIILIFVSGSTPSVLAHGVDHCGAGIALSPAAAKSFSSVFSACRDTGEDDDGVSQFSLPTFLRSYFVLFLGRIFLLTVALLL